MAAEWAPAPLSGRPRVQEPAVYRDDTPAAVERRLWQTASRLAASLSDQALVGQVLMVGVPEVASLSAASLAWLRAIQPGAILLFRYNLPAGIAALQAYTSLLAGAGGGLRPFLAIDHEGGTVYRFGDETTRLPSAHRLAAAPRAAELASLTGRIAAWELAGLGFSLNLAPIVEAASGPGAVFLEFRAWGSVPLQAAAHGRDYIQASQAAGLAAAAKHFPGSGGGDPHQALASLPGDAASIRQRYLEPFRLALDSQPAAVILSHVRVPAFDDSQVATFSASLVDTILKGELGFRGLVLSDDLFMRALADSGSLTRRASLALQAGVDMLMLSSLEEAVAVHANLVAALRAGQLERARLLDAATRCLAQKLRFLLINGQGGPGIDRRLSAAAQAKLLAANSARLQAMLGD
ncbi:MAG: hypothetical protein A2087_11075 [Spirochaetes bacterium GWD1_61_31]|nr:MAG: hypothetical protein A2Y37_09975 [Spirochaetes bacterium GWB1_60_80]OHD43120.1 MAG: hypothetical protein A2087_11075 [Spirochaetes bacterium GWD1_61_31]OHD60386.1 MAG: hypothetical protein A2Y32_00655 [Spirochaetes bacterium GWF1_60_12]HAP43300.1 hypothetical protein [Spirochaetaceae bacterium]HAW87000.1 hypothetical protein [Spirochaetaceae bacterium]